MKAFSLKKVHRQFSKESEMKKLLILAFLGVLVSAVVGYAVEETTWGQVKSLMNPQPVAKSVNSATVFYYPDFMLNVLENGKLDLDGEIGPYVPVEAKVVVNNNIAILNIKCQVLNLSGKTQVYDPERLVQDFGFPVLLVFPIEEGGEWRIIDNFHWVVTKNGMCTLIAFISL